MKSIPGWYDVEDYGAVPDYNSATGAWTTPNYDAFRAAINAAKAEAAGYYGALNGKQATVYANGHFYIEKTLELDGSVNIVGNGAVTLTPPHAARSASGTRLVFGTNKTGVRILSPRDPGGKGAECTAIRNIQISQKNPPSVPMGMTGHGIHATAPFILENVVIDGFPQYGVYGYGVVNQANVDSSLLIGVRSVYNGTDGFHFVGQDATACSFFGCSAMGNRRYGFFDDTRLNAYAGCHSEENGIKTYEDGTRSPAPIEAPLDIYHDGCNYYTKGNNSSTFIGCYNEGASDRRKNKLNGFVTVIGGSLGGLAYCDEKSEAFVLVDRAASFAPIKYSNSRGSTLIESYLGYNKDAVPKEAITALGWEAPNLSDLHRLKYVPKIGAGTLGLINWWSLERDNSIYNHLIRFPAASSGARSPAPWVPNGLILGSGGITDTQSLHLAATAVPDHYRSGHTTYRTYEVGDVVWNTGFKAGSSPGWVCTDAGTKGTLNGGATKVVSGSGTKLVVSSLAGLTEGVGQYINIPGISGRRQILAIDKATLTLTLTEAMDASPQVDKKISFYNPTHEALLGKATTDTLENKTLAGFLFQAEQIIKTDAMGLTLSATQQKAGIIEFTGSPTGRFEVIGPTTTNKQYWLSNFTDQPMVFKKSGGTGVTIAASKSAVVRYSSSVADYVRMTPDA